MSNKLYDSESGRRIRLNKILSKEIKLFIKEEKERRKNPFYRLYIKIRQFIGI